MQIERLLKLIGREESLFLDDLKDHGGLMDRLDGFLVAATLVAAVGVARGGLDAAAQGAMRW